MHLVEVDHNRTAWVMPNFTCKPPFSAEELSSLTSAVVFGSEKAWATFDKEDILIFHGT